MAADRVIPARFILRVSYAIDTAINMERPYAGPYQGSLRTKDRLGGSAPQRSGPSVVGTRSRLSAGPLPVRLRSTD